MGVAWILRMVALIQIDSGHPSELAHFQPFKNLLFRPFQQVKIFRAERQISDRSEVICRVTKFLNFLSKFFFVKLKWFNSLKLPKLAFAKLSNFGLLFFLPFSNCSICSVENDVLFRCNFRFSLSLICESSSWSEELWSEFPSDVASFIPWSEPNSPNPARQENMNIYMRG